MTTLTRRWPKLAAALVCVTCATSPRGSTPIEARTTTELYFPDEVAQVELTNHSGRELGYNLCASMELDRRVGAEWVPLARDADRVCTMELRRVPPGESRVGEVQVPGDLQPGVHRFRFVGLAWTDGSEPPPGPVLTREFEVRAR